MNEKQTTLAASVVVPTFKRHDLLVRCIRALENQDLAPEQFEVLIVDDANSPATRQLVEDLATKSPAKIRYLAVTGTHGPAAARNVGWQAARGDWIACTDDDCVPEQNWLSSSVASRNRPDAAWGQIMMPLPEHPTDYERDAAGLASAGFVTANCFCRRDALEQVGGFDERFRTAWREDSDLYFSLREHGFRVEHLPAAVVVHPIRPAAWGISLRQQRKTMFNALLYKKHRELYRKIVPPMPWRYYAVVASGGVAILAAASGRPAWAWPAAAVWAGLTLEFCLRRLRNTSRRPAHVAEMLVTSMLIPPLSLYWHVRGALRYRVLFI